MCNNFIYPIKNNFIYFTNYYLLIIRKRKKEREREKEREKERERETLKKQY